MGSIKSPLPRVTHGIDLRQTRHESLMGTFYVDDFYVNRCNINKTSSLHGAVLRKSLLYTQIAQVYSVRTKRATTSGSPIRVTVVTHDCASLILDSIAKELLVSTIFCMAHPYIAIHSVE